MPNDQLPLDDLEKGDSHRHAEEQGDEGQMEEWLVEEDKHATHVPPQSADDVQAIADMLEDDMADILEWAQEKKKQDLLDLIEKATRNLDDLNKKELRRLYGYVKEFESTHEEESLHEL